MATGSPFPWSKVKEPSQLLKSQRDMMNGKINPLILGEASVNEERIRSAPNNWEYYQLYYWDPVLHVRRYHGNQTKAASCGMAKGNDPMCFQIKQKSIAYTHTWYVN